MAFKIDIDYHKKHFEKATKSGNHPEIADSANSLGDTYLHLGEYKKAIEYFEIGVKSCNEIENYSELAAIMQRKKGKGHIELKEYTKAIDCLKRNISLSRDQIIVARSNEDLGRAYFELGQYEEAINCYKLALETCTATGDQPGIVNNCINLGISHRLMGEIKNGLDYSKRGLEESITLHNRSTIAINHKELGISYFSLGENENAIYHFEQYLEINSIKGSQSENAVINILCEAYLNSRKYEKAIELSKKGLEINTAMDNHSQIAKGNEQLGKAYQSLGENEKAIEHFKLALAINTETKNQSGIASNCTHLAIRYVIIGENEKGIEFSTRGLEASTAIGDHRNIALNNRILGEIYSKMGGHEKAIYHHKKNLEIISSIGSQSEIASGNRVLGDVYFNAHKCEEAVDSYRISLEIYTAIDDRLEMADANFKLGNAYYMIREFEKAIDCFKQMLEFSAELDYKKGISCSYMSLGMVYVSLGDCKKAKSKELPIKYHNRCLEKATTSGRHLEMADSTSLSGDASLDLSVYKKAIECFEKGIESCTENDNSSKLATNQYRFMGEAYLELKEYTKAIDCFKKNLLLCDDQILVARSNEDLGRAYFKLGQYEEAINCHKLALETCTAIGDQQGIVNNCINLGISHRLMGEIKNGLQYSKRGLEESITLDNRSAIAINHKELGISYFSLGENENAIYHFEQYLEINSIKGSQSENAVINILCEAYLNSRKYEKAIELSKKGLEINTAMDNHSQIAKWNEQLGKAYQSLGENEKAIDHFKSALAINTETKNQSGIASNCTHLAIRYISIGENEKGIEFSTRGLEASTAIGHHRYIALNNKILGEIYSKMGEHEKAIYHHKKNLEIISSIGSQSEIALGNRILGDVYFSAHKCEEAVASYRISLEKYTAIDDRLEMAYANCKLGNAYDTIGEFEKAIDCFEQMLKFCTELNDKKGISDCYGNLGAVHLRLGQYKTSTEYFKKVSTDPFDPNADTIGTLTNSINLACAYMHLGKYNMAFDMYNKCLEIATENGNRSAMANINHNLGNFYQIMGEYEKSIKYLRESLEIVTEFNDRSLMVAGNCALGQAYSFMKKYEMAIDCNKKSLEIATAMGSQVEMACSNESLGQVYCILGKYDVAIFYLKRAFEKRANIADCSMASINLILSAAYRDLGIHLKAVEHCKTSLEISIAIEDPNLIAGSNKRFGEIYYCSAQYEVASKYLIKSITDYDEQFLNAVPDQYKLSFTEVYFNAHKILMSCFVSLSRIKAGLLVIDLGRAKELHLSIEKKQNSFDADLFGYARSIWDKIENEREQEEIERIQNLLQIGNNEVKASIVVFAFDLKRTLNVWTLNGDMIFRVSALSDGKLETFVQSIITFSQRFNVRMNRDSSFFKVHPCGNLFSKINSCFKLPSKKNKLKTTDENTSRNDDVNSETILKELYNILIEPVKDVVKGNKLIIVPERQLFFVPFSSLIDENDCYLSQSYSIQITPSLHTLKLSMERSNDSVNPGFALFVGNPTVGKVSLNDSELEPRSLPKAAEEVASLAKLFTVRPLVKAEAKKQVILGLLSNASIIHIAAHGQAKNGEIMLAPDLSLNEPSSSLPNTDSYLLTQNDITSASLQARLVVLCCCHTGQGEISSEGVIGVARSFLAAGARSVLATLWGINDHATKKFMEAFYSELLQETPVCEALRRAMSFFQQHEREDYRSFSIWAPFTLYGEDVKFTKDDIETIREKSSETLPECGFALFVGNPTSDLPEASEEVNSLSKLFKAKAFVEREARKQVLLGLLSGASIIHISSHIEPKQCAIMLSPCVSSNQGSLTLPKQDDILTQQDVKGLSLNPGLVVLCLCDSEQDEVSPEGVETLALSFLAAGARSVLTTLTHSDDDATTEFIKEFYNHLLHESSVREALEKTKKLFEKHDKEAYRSFVSRAPFKIYGEDVMFQKHDIETIREKSNKMFSGFVILPSDEPTGSFENLNLQDKP